MATQSLGQKLRGAPGPSAPAAASRPGEQGAQAAAGDGSPQHAACLVTDTDTGFAFRVRPVGGTVWIFPYHHVSRVVMTEAERSVQIMAGEFVITITGRKLGDVAEALQRGWHLVASAVDEKYKDDYKGSEVFISKIDVAEVVEES